MAAIHVREGNGLLGGGRLDDAAARYRLAIEAVPRHADAHVNLGFVLLEMGRTDEALTVLRRAADLPPAPPMPLPARDGLAEGAAAGGGQSADVRAMRLPSRPILSSRIAIWPRHCTTSGSKRARRRCTVAIDPGQPDLHLFLGNIALHEMDLDAAMDSYDHVLKIEPDHAVALSNKAQALLQLGDFDAAEAAARRAVAIDPALHFARSNLLLSLSSDGHTSPRDYLAEARRYGESVTPTTPPPVLQRPADPSRLPLAPCASGSCPPTCTAIGRLLPRERARALGQGPADGRDRLQQSVRTGRPDDPAQVALPVSGTTFRAWATMRRHARLQGTASTCLSTCPATPRRTGCRCSHGVRRRCRSAGSGIGRAPVYRPWTG